MTADDGWSLRSIAGSVALTLILMLVCATVVAALIGLGYLIAAIVT